MTVSGVRGPVTPRSLVEAEGSIEQEIGPADRMKPAGPLDRLAASSVQRRRREAVGAFVSNDVTTPSGDENEPPRRADNEKQETPAEPVSRAGANQPPEEPPRPPFTQDSALPPPDRDAILATMGKLVTGLFKPEDLGVIYDALSQVGYDRLELTIGVYAVSKILQEKFETKLVQFFLADDDDFPLEAGGQPLSPELIREIKEGLMVVNDLIFSPDNAGEPAMIAEVSDVDLLQEIISRSLRPGHRVSHVYALTDAIINSDNPENLLEVRKIILIREKYDSATRKEEKTPDPKAGEGTPIDKTASIKATKNRKMQWIVAPDFASLSNEDQNRLHLMMKNLMRSERFDALVLSLESYASLYNVLSRLDAAHLTLATRAMEMSVLIKDVLGSEVALIDIVLNEYGMSLIDTFRVDKANRMGAGQFRELDETVREIRRMLTRAGSPLLVQPEEMDVHEETSDEELFFEIIRLGIENENDIDGIFMLAQVMEAAKFSKSLLGVHKMISFFVEVSSQEYEEGVSWNLLSEDKKREILMKGVRNLFG